jgi:two-component system sensor histidine kinase PilS (NtrC family)
VTTPVESRVADPRAAAPGGGLFRLVQVFSLARLLLGSMLLSIELVLALYASVPYALPVLLLSAGHVLSAWGVYRWQQRTPPAETPALVRRRRWWVATLGVDLSVFTALLILVGSGQNLAAVFALPVLMASVLARRRMALAVAAGVALILLGVAWIEVLDGWSAAVLFPQAGIAGAGLFLVAVLTGELSNRLARQELVTRNSLGLARQQAALNRLMIDEMVEGVMVIDRSGLVRAANPAALALLDLASAPLTPPFLLQRTEAGTLWSVVDEGFVSGVWPGSGREVAVGPGVLRVRLRLTREPGGEGGQMLGVLFLEDLRTIEARMRQDRLAAMGRFSTAIAHEIRNPLAAIAQANALLMEDIETGPQVRLLRMVADNVERLRRIVDDVMEVAPGAAREVPWLDPAAQIAAICAEWLKLNGLIAAPDGPLLIDLPESGAAGGWIHFDSDHLRRVVINLLDNALRHSSRGSGCMSVRLMTGQDGVLELQVANDGTRVSAEVVPHLFEPFFSTRSRGIGLGLYICRELCERYGAQVVYRARTDDALRHNEFAVILPCGQPDPFPVP